MGMRFQLRSPAEIKMRLGWAHLTSSWMGTFVVAHLVGVAAAYSPLTGTIAGWYGAWWCYANIEKGGWGRVIVGFFCWQLSYEAVVGVMSWAIIQVVTIGGCNA